MSDVAGHPVQSMILGAPTNVTIAASMAGTAAATVLSTSVSFSYARGFEVFNLTGRNIELIIGGAADPGTANWTPGTPSIVSVVTGATSVFCPGTATAVPGAGRGFRMPLAVSQGQKLWVRTTENTPITCASTTPLIISFWA